MSKKGLSADNIWVISDGKSVNLDLSKICKEQVTGPIIEYKISALARYLLNPESIQLHEKVVGCKVRYKKKGSGRLAGLFQKKKKTDDKTDADSNIEEIISASKIGTPGFKDERLNAHLMKIRDMLAPYDPVRKKLAGLDRENIEDVQAMCEEVGGQRYALNLQGSLDDKINFITGALARKAKVVFTRAYLSNGLFELRPFDLTGFDPDIFYRLIKFSRNSETRYGVLDKKYKFEFWIDDNVLVNYLHIFEQSIKADEKLRDAMSVCIRGTAQPLKIFFTKKLEHGYSEKRIPVIYSEVFRKYKIGHEERDAIINALNKAQGVVFFNYLSCSDDGSQRINTNISVMHDSRALEPIKGRLPSLYSEIDKKTKISEAGKLYLLDSIREYQNV